MHVCLVSTYPPQRCGIATYSRDLARAIRPLLPRPITVLSEVGHPEVADGACEPHAAFRRRGDYGAAVLEAVVAHRPDVVHIQHAPDILGSDDRLPRLVNELRRRGVPVVVTLHTVHSGWSSLIDGQVRPHVFHRALAGAGAHIIVHEKLGQAELVRQGVHQDAVSVVPHGTTSLSLPGRAESRAHLGLSQDGPLLLYFGFIRIVKNIHTLLFAMRHLRRSVPDCRLLVVGSVQGGAWYNRLYLAGLRRLRKVLGLSNHVEIREGFVSDEDVPFLYGAADVMLLPYAQRYASASGIVHGAIGAGRALLCSDSPKFAEVAENVSREVVVPTHDARAWADRLKSMLQEPERRARLERLMTDYAAATSWDRVAAGHVEIYRRLATAPGTADSAAAGK